MRADLIDYLVARHLADDEPTPAELAELGVTESDLEQVRTIVALDADLQQKRADEAEEATDAAMQVIRDKIKAEQRRIEEARRRDDPPS